MANADAFLTGALRTLHLQFRVLRVPLSVDLPSASKSVGGPTMNGGGLGNSSLP